MVDKVTGTGPDTLVVEFQSKQFEGAPLANIFVLRDDGFGGLRYEGNAFEGELITAPFGGADTDSYTINGDWSGNTGLGVTYLNDRWGGTTATDRNLYVSKVTFNGNDLGLNPAIETGGNHLVGTFSGDLPPGGGGPAVPGLTVNGGPGADTLYGGAGPDTINGFAGDDAMNGFAGDDVLRGGSGSDVLVGGTGNDAVTTNGGVDRILFGHGDGDNIVTDFAIGFDSVVITGGATDTEVGNIVRDGFPGTLISFADDPATMFLQGTPDGSLGTVVA